MDEGKTWEILKDQASHTKQLQLLGRFPRPISLKFHFSAHEWSTSNSSQKCCLSLLPLNLQSEFLPFALNCSVFSLGLEVFAACLNQLYTGRLFYCYMLDESMFHFGGVGSVLWLLFCLQ